MSSQAQKAGRVAIVYSDNERYSAESRNLAYYLCGLLSATGYADIVMVPFSPQGPVVDLPIKRILYIPPGQQKPREVPGADVTFAHWNSLTTCHLVVSTVNSHDAQSCGAKLAETLQSHKHIPIFSLQRGLKHTSFLTEAESKSNTVIEAIVGFSVVVDPKNNAFVSTTRSPAIMFSRLSKEQVKVADLPLRLLETMDVSITFRKVMTPFSYGVMIFENLYALNILTKGTINETIDNYRYRQILALMVRENILVLAAASRGGAWKPSLLLVSGLLSPKLFEFMLLLPNPLFQAVYWLLGLYPSLPVISPGQQDLVEGRKTMTATNLQEIIEVGKRNDVDSPVSQLVLNAILSVESPLDARVPIHSYQNVDLIKSLEIALVDNYPTHDSFSELGYYVVRGVAIISIIAVLIFLFHHD